MQDKRPSTPLARIAAPVERRLSRAGRVALAAGALWPVQAAGIAVSVHLWATGAVAAGPAAGLVAAFVAAGLARAALDRRAGGIAQEAALDMIARERRALVEAESRRIDRPASSAAIAALLAQKLPLLGPYATRFRLAKVRAAVLPLALIALVFSFSWVAAAILLIALPLIPVFQALVGMAAKEASARQMEEIGDLNSLLADRLAAAPDIRLLAASGRAADGFADRAEGLRAATMGVLRVAFLSSTVLELFAALGVALVAVYVGFSLLGEIGFGAWAAPLTLGQGVFVLLLAPEVFQPLRDLAAAWHDKVAADAVAEEIETLRDRQAAEAVGFGAPAEPLPGGATVRMRGATATRGGAAVPLPDLDAAPGAAVALTGPSGSGKTTALMALAGLLPLAAGRIEVAGRPLDPQTADAWRARLAWVPQHVHVPDVTLAEFLDPRQTGRDPAPALRAARAAHVVAALPEGLATRLGESGAGVSGGEARRLLLARALLSEADAVLCDEPTADLDAETAAAVRAVLRQLAERGATVLVATHDPELIAALDGAVPMPRKAAAA